VQKIHALTVITAAPEKEKRHTQLCRTSALSGGHSHPLQKFSKK